MISDARKKDLEKQGYRLVGNHSAVKVCHYVKRSLRCEDVCYKNTFYGIKSWRCVQMTPALNTCQHRCMWCWRDITFTSPVWEGPVDDPKTIIDGCVEEQVKYLVGFGGNKKCDPVRFSEARRPLHFAISLSGEPTMYGRLPELIDELKVRGYSSFLVTNGANPEMLVKLLQHEPTQLYITLPAPNKKIYSRVCAPLVKDGWEKIGESLFLFNKFTCRKAVRLTVVKGENMVDPEGYAMLLKNIKVDFVEVKAFMFVGYSRTRLSIEAMPSHAEVKSFAEKLAELLNYKILDEKKASRVVLIGPTERSDRIIKY